MAHIFMVEDNPTMITTVSKALVKWQHQVTTVHNWSQVAQEVVANQPDLVLFDITLPSFDGFYWIQEVRKRSTVPIIVISAADIDSNVMHAVAAGADDYLMKPFSMAVLLAKVQALLRRTKQKTNQAVIGWGTNRFNTLTNVIRNDQGSTQLTPTEGAMLTVLIHHGNQAVKKEQLLEWLWQGGKYLDDNILNVNVSRLRHKLSRLGLAAALVTKRGVGYRLVTGDE